MRAIISSVLEPIHQEASTLLKSRLKSATYIKGKLSPWQVELKKLIPDISPGPNGPESKIKLI